MKKTAAESIKIQKIREKLRKILMEQEEMISKEALAQMIDQIRFSAASKSRFFNKKSKLESEVK